MPVPDTTGSLYIDPEPSLSLETLRKSLHDFSQSRLSPTQSQSLAEIRQYRSHLAKPLDPAADRPPNPQDRQQISGLRDVSLTLPDPANPVVRLGPDLVSVAIALSDELHINELLAGVLLYQARSQAAHRPDHDVVLAAKDLFFLKRRESIVYLQEILRAGLLTGGEERADEEENFVAALMRERDLLVVEHHLFANVQQRLTEGIRPENRQGGSVRNPKALQKGEAVLLAETLFLLAYTVQLSSSEALALRSLLDSVDAVHEAVKKEEMDVRRATRAPQPFEEMERKETAVVELMSVGFVEVESVRNLLFLAWTCALDRSRYHDVYDPRTGVQGVNLLLKDINFIDRTNQVPKLEDNEDQDKVSQLSRARAAADLCAAVFALAVAEPNEDDALLRALRVSAFGGALSFLSEDLADWIANRAGSLCIDTDLYADVVEDLALDIAEAPQLVSSLIQFTHNEVLNAASEVAYAPFEGNAQPSGRLPLQMSPGPSPFSHRRNSLQVDNDNSTHANRRHSTASASLRGRPPRPPGPRNSTRVPSTTIGDLTSAFTAAEIPPETKREQRISDIKEEVRPKLVSKENLTASLARFVARAVSLAPSKLNTDSVGGGLRYWAGVGSTTGGLIPQIGDAVIDLWDTSMRNPHASGGVGEAFQEALNGFLLLLASTAKKEGSPSHASSALRFLRDSGQSAVSLEKAAEALAHFNKMLTSPTTARGAQLDIADAVALQSIIDVIANAAETLTPLGGITHLLGEPGKEFSMRMASLATHDISPCLKDSLLKAMSGLDNRRAISLFLESVANDNAAPLRRFLRATEAPSGAFHMTIRVLHLTAKTVSWGDDEFPESAVESITTWFAIEEILAFWSRLKYGIEAHRWVVVRAAAHLISEVVKRNPTSERSFRILARLLTPAPGTGAASFSLRSLAYAAGLMRVGDDREATFVEGHGDASDNDKDIARLYQVAGRDSLIHAAEHGLGEAYREMQSAAQVAARLITLILSVPSGQISVPGIVVAPASELLLGEVKAISCAASLVFAASGFIPSIARAGYSPSVCAAVLGMLAKASQESAHIAGVLARDTLRTTGTAAQFRASLANIISRSTTEATEAERIRNESQNELSMLGQSQDPPIMHSALRIVEASLGMDGGSSPGMFLLGLQFDTSGFYTSAEYGVLGALVELVAGAHDATGRVDDKCRSTAATFLERLAANTVRKTSVAVLEHLKEVANPNDPNVRGGGFADEMLFRILDAVGLHESVNYSTVIVDWGAIGELLSASMSLSALQVRMFPKYEIETSMANFRGSPLDINSGAVAMGQAQHFPSPIDLLKLLALTAGSGEVQIAFEALRTWAHLLGTRLDVHERTMGYSSVPVLFELTTMLLGSLIGADSSNDLSALVKKDGGEMASSVVLLCVTRMRGCDNPHETGSEEYIGDIQCTALLNGVVRAIAAVVGFGANAARARTSLYAVFLICGSLAKSRISEDAVGRAFGGRCGPRQVSGSEAVISAACADAISGPNAASKAAAMSAASMTTILDPVRSVVALGTQNRLKKVVYSALGEAESRRLVAQACAGGLTESFEGVQETAKERAAIVVTEAAISLVHSVSSAGNGARVVSDSGVMESAGLLLSSLSSPRLLDYGDRRMDIMDIRDERSHQRRRRTGYGEMGFANIEESEDEWLGSNGSMVDVGELDRRTEVERRVSMIASVTGAMAAVICCANGAVIDSTVAALGEGKEVLLDLLRSIRSLRSSDLEAIGNVGMIMSRIPYELVNSAGYATRLRRSLASVVGAIIPAPSHSYQIGASGSPFSAGINLRRPENQKEVRRKSILHPEGGSLFERDLIRERTNCAQNVFATLRCPTGLLYLFLPHLGENMREGRRKTGRSASSGSPVVAGRLSEIVRISRATLKEMQRSAEESMQTDARIAGETATSISTRRVDELSEFCEEEYNIGSGTLNGQIVLDCLKKSSASARAHADICMSIVEGALFILREYIRTARETMRGHGPLVHDGVFGEDGKEAVGFGLEMAEALLNDAKRMVVPICKEVEALTGGVWGSKDSSFCKQLCRQIRTACTGRG